MSAPKRAKNARASAAAGNARVLTPKASSVRSTTFGNQQSRSPQAARVGGSSWRCFRSQRQSEFAGAVAKGFDRSSAPSASAYGGAGACVEINIITRKTHHPARTATVSATFWTEGESVGRPVRGHEPENFRTGRRGGPAGARAAGGDERAGEAAEPVRDGRAVVEGGEAVAARRAVAGRAGRRARVVAEERREVREVAEAEAGLVRTQRRVGVPGVGRDAREVDEDQGRALVRRRAVGGPDSDFAAAVVQVPVGHVVARVPQDVVRVRRVERRHEGAPLLVVVQPFLQVDVALEAEPRGPPRQEVVQHRFVRPGEPEEPKVVDARPRELEVRLPLSVVGVRPRDVRRDEDRDAM